MHIQIIHQNTTYKKNKTPRDAVLIHYLTTEQTQNQGVDVMELKKHGYIAWKHTFKCQNGRNYYHSVNLSSSLM